LPLLIAAGVVEYPGPHLSVGVDYLIASSVLEQVERRLHESCVLAPGLPFGPTGEWAGGAADGEAYPGAIPLFHYVKPIFRSYLGMGFEKVLICQHHQNWTGPHQGALRLADAELMQELGYELGGGPGWGRLPKKERPEVFGRIAVRPAGSFAIFGTICAGRTSSLSFASARPSLRALNRSWRWTSPLTSSKDSPTTGIRAKRGGSPSVASPTV